MANLLTLYARSLRPAQAGWWALPLRAFIGFDFLFHGYAKLSHGPDKFGHILAGLVALAFGGDSPLSVDRLLRRRVDSAHHQN